MGTVTSYIQGDNVGLYCGATLPDARKQGVCKQLLIHALNDAKKQDCKIAVAQLMAKNMAKGITESLGFGAKCYFTPYAFGVAADSIEP